MSVADRLKEAWNSHDPSRVAALYAENGVREEFFGAHAVLRGREEIATQLGGYIHAVPDCNLQIKRVVEGADGTIALEWTWGGTHSGDLPNLPAGGGQIELPGSSTYDMDGDLIARENLYCDFSILLTSAGLIGK